MTTHQRSALEAIRLAHRSNLCFTLLHPFLILFWGMLLIAPPIHAQETPLIPIVLADDGADRGCPGHQLQRAAPAGGREPLPPSVLLPLIYNAFRTGPAQVTPEEGGEAFYSPSQLQVRIPAGAVISHGILRIGPASMPPPAGLTDLNLLAEVELRDAWGKLTPIPEPARHNSIQLCQRGSEPDRRRQPGHPHQDSTGAWVKLPTNLDSGSRTASATVNHFSPFGLFRSPLVDGVGALAMTVDTAGNLLWFDFQSLTILQKFPGVSVPTVRSDLQASTPWWVLGIWTWTGSRGRSTSPTASGSIGSSQARRRWPSTRQSCPAGRSPSTDSASTPATAPSTWPRITTLFRWTRSQERRSAA